MQFNNTTSAADAAKAGGSKTMNAQLPAQTSSSAQSAEIEDAKDKLKIMTTKFSATRKERDQLKTENKELQNEVLLLQSSMRQMVPCTSNTS